MTNDDRAEFFGMCVTLAAVTRAEMDEPTQHLYFRAMRDVPMELVRRASVELAKASKFMPTPAEWRSMVDDVIEKRQANGKQPLLPGEVGASFRCENCDNTGFVSSERPCTKGANCGPYRHEHHTHAVVARCQDAICQKFRQQQAQRKRRYSREA